MHTSRRLRSEIAAVSLALLVPGGLVQLVPAAAAPHRAAATCENDAGTDFDFHGTGSDVAIGVPGEDIGTVRDAGAVEVRYGCDSPMSSQGLSLANRHAGDRFGASLASGAFLDHDGSVVEALWVGVPGLDVNGHADAGGVAVFHGSATGLHFVRLITQATAGIAGTVQTGAHFGAAVAVSTRDSEAFTLTVGEPGRDVGTAKDAGAFVEIHWNEDPEIADSSRESTLSTYGSTPQSGDQLGSALSVAGGTLSVGAPGRKVNGKSGAGAVLRTSEFGTPLALLTQATTGMPGDPETGDHFGAALAGDWIGVPDEAIGTATGAGMVEYWNPQDSASPAVALAQDTPGVPGDKAVGNRFGAALTEEAGDAFGSTDLSTLFVGAPGESSGTGSVTALREAGLPTSSSPDYTGLAGRLVNSGPVGAHFGATLASSGEHRVEVGAPAATGGRVATYLSPDGFATLPSLESSWVQVTGVPEVGDGYGAALPEDGGDF